MRKMLKIAVGVVVLGAFAPVAAVGVAADRMVQAAAPEPDATYGNVAVADDDFVLGRADAPVTIVEYASLTCPHCASFHADVLPKLKESYIDSGKVRLVYRDFPLDRYALAASMMARCAGRERYFSFVDVLFQEQSRWARSQNPMQSLSRLGRIGGLTPEKFNACLQDKDLQTQVLEQRLKGSKDYQVNSTPTLIINGRKYGGGLSFAQIEAILAPLLPKS